LGLTEKVVTARKEHWFKMSLGSFSRPLVERSGGAFRLMARAARRKD
jgi:hypothetical protein